MILIAIMAAGQSKRFGRDKRQELLDSGMTMLAQVIKLYQQTDCPIVLVIPANDPFGMYTAQQYAVPILENPQAASGMGSSVSLAIRYAAQHGYQQVMIALADMPHIQPTTIQQTLQASIQQQDQLICPVYKAELGFPRVIPYRYFSQLLALVGDQGASQRLNWKAAYQLEVSDEGVILDIDVVER